MAQIRLLFTVLLVASLAILVFSQDNATTFQFGHSGGANEQFVNAIQTGDRAWAERILKQDLGLLKLRDRYQRSPVFLAASATKNRAAMVSWLLELGADVNATQQNGFTPLYWAALLGDTEVVDILLKHHADVNVRSKDGKSALYAAVSHGFSDVAMRLIQSGAEVNVVSKEGWTPLHLAARRGDQPLVEALLAAGADPRAGSATLTPLREAAIQGHRDIVAILMAHDPEAADPKRAGWTRLHQAARTGRADDIDKLLKQRVRIDPLDPLKRSPLHYAAEQGHTEAVRALLAGGANPNLVDGPNGELPLHLAAKNGHAAALELLLKYGSPVDAPSRQRLTALTLAVVGDHREIVKLLLLKGADPNSVGPLGLTVLQQAVYSRRLDIANLLASHGARVDIHSASGMNRADVVTSLLATDASQIEYRLANGATPLHIAARCGAADAATVLLARKANINSSDQIGQTPLHVAAEFGQLNIARILLGAGARLNFDDKGKAIVVRVDTRSELEGQYKGTPLTSPLHLAAARGPKEMVELLLKHGADAKAPAAIVEINILFGWLKNGGETPLHDAAKGTCTECVALLLERRADVRATDVHGLTPLLWAVDAGRIRAAALLLDAGADVNHRVGNKIPLQIAAYNGHPAMVELLLSRGADVNATLARGDTALHRAVGSLRGAPAEKPITAERLAVVELLLRHRARANASGFLGNKPLHLAAERGYIEAVQLLLTHGADPNARNSSGSTPLHMAAMRGRVEVSARLLSSGAEVNARSQHNIPLSLAVRFQHNDVVSLLLKHGADVHFVSDRGVTLFDELISSKNKWTLAQENLAKMLLDAGLDIHDGAGQQGTTLHRAVRDGRRELAKLLIDRGAQINARDRYQRTPLHIAVNQKQLEIVKMLIDRGAEINPRDSQNNTPMYYAWGSGISARIKEVLRRHGGAGGFGEPHL